MLVQIRRISSKKSFKDCSNQMERIITLYYQGYGNDHIFSMCEKLYFDMLKKYGY